MKVVEIIDNENDAIVCQIPASSWEDAAKIQDEIKVYPGFRVEFSSILWSSEWEREEAAPPPNQ